MAVARATLSSPRLVRPRGESIPQGGSEDTPFLSPRSVQIRIAVTAVWGVCGGAGGRIFRSRRRHLIAERWRLARPAASPRAAAGPCAKVERGACPPAAAWLPTLISAARMFCNAQRLTACLRGEWRKGFAPCKGVWLLEIFYVYAHLLPGHQTHRYKLVAQAERKLRPRRALRAG